MFTQECFRPRKKVILYLHFTNLLRSGNIYKLFMDTTSIYDLACAKADIYSAHG